MTTRIASISINKLPTLCTPLKNNTPLPLHIPYPASNKCFLSAYLLCAQYWPKRRPCQGAGHQCLFSGGINQISTKRLPTGVSTQRKSIRGQEILKKRREGWRLLSLTKGHLSWNWRRTRSLTQTGWPLALARGSSTREERDPATWEIKLHRWARDRSFRKGVPWIIWSLPRKSR